MTVVFQCDECGKTGMTMLQEFRRFRPVGPGKRELEEMTRSTGRHFCPPCANRIAPLYRERKEVEA